MSTPRRNIAAFTLIELMIGIAIVAIIVTLTAPSFRDMILMQRLRGANAQLVTDINFARSEAVSRASYMQVRFQTTASGGGMSCYIIYARTDGYSSPLCDCTAAEGSRCTDARTTEVRTVQLPQSESVIAAVSLGANFYTIDPRTGGMAPARTDLSMSAPQAVQVDTSIDTARKFRNVIGQSGRVSTCIPVGSKISGTDAC